MKLTLAVTGVGTLSPVGLTGLSTLHSIRSGISRLASQPYPDRGGEWIVGSIVPRWIPEMRDRRLSVLAREAICGALERAGADVNDSTSMRKTALILGAAERIRPGYRYPPPGPRFRDLIRDTELETIGNIEIILAGACSAQSALMRAAQLFETTGIQRCVIGAADTQVQLRTIRWHEQNYRLKCSYLTDGLMPGEAASFVVVEPEASALKNDSPIIARILSANRATEGATSLSDLPNLASGLTEAVAASLQEANIPAAEVGTVWTDLNGESYRAREWAFTELRLGFTDRTDLQHPADCHGDLGAATDANLIGLAAISHSTGWSDGRPALVLSGSEGGLRAATVLVPSATRPHHVQVSKRLPRVFSDQFAIPVLDERAERSRGSVDPMRAQFEWQLREEHRDELASLHYQRKSILDDGTISWLRLREPEQRMLNHLDAAVAGGSESIAVMAQGIDEDEEGLCFSGAFLIGTLPHQRNFARIDAAFTRPSVPRLAGIATALLHVPDSVELRTALTTWMDATDPTVQALAVSVASARRVDVRGHLPAVTRDSPFPLIVAVAEACRRLCLRGAADRLRLLLDVEDIDARRAVLAALTVIAPDSAAAFGRSALVSNRAYGGGPARCLAVTGELSDVTVLLQHVEADPEDLAAIEALGILGAPAAVPHLIWLLEADDAIRVAAASALALMSGLAPRERVSVAPAAPTSDEDTSPSEVERVSTSPDLWKDWWDRHQTRLDRRQRWRRGGYFGIAACIDELEDPESTYRSRSRAGLELAVQTGSPIAFEADWFVQRQLEAVAHLRMQAERR